MLGLEGAPKFEADREDRDMEHISQAGEHQDHISSCHTQFISFVDDSHSYEDGNVTLTPIYTSHQSSRKEKVAANVP